MPANVSIAGDDALTLDMLHQYAYCPRRFHLMYVEGRWDDNAYTIEGRTAHRRVDDVDHLLPETKASEAKPADDPGGDPPPQIARSVPLASAELGLSAKLDLVSADVAAADGLPPEAVPVETKRGRVPQNAERSWEPERVQLMAQGLLLREHGYRCQHGVLYFATSRTRVAIPFTDELEARTRQLLADAHAASHAEELPAPLEDSPKCGGCSLSGICLPDETLTLRAHAAEREAIAKKPRSGNEEENPSAIRRLYPPRPDATPLYVQEQGAYVGKSGTCLVVKVHGQEVSRAALKDVSQLVLCGNVQVSTQTMQFLCESEVPVVMLSTGMWFYGIASGISLRNAYDRAAQFAAAADTARRLLFAKSVVRDKAQNQRTLLRRNVSPGLPLDHVLEEIDELIVKVDCANNTESLLGLEGNVASRYFAMFSQMLRPRDFDAEWDFNSRNRRPPKDPVNAMLSFAYALLAKECTVALLAEGLDPWWGLYHRPRHGRPALALDVMEPLRPIIADSAVITAINTGMVGAADFERTATACAMNAGARKAMLRAYEARLEQMITHPVFDYRCSWRSVIRLQARLLARWLRGDVPDYTSLVTR